MPGTAILRGPVPATALGFCAICAATAKNHALGPHRAEIEAFERAGEGTRAWELAMHRPPAPAVAWGVYPPLGAALPLCWTHLIALDIRAGSIIPASANSLPPPPGPGGAADLSRRRN